MTKCSQRTHGATNSKARLVLDRVRELLGVCVVGPPCGFCGAARGYNCHVPCPLCHGRPVEAENIVRTIREIVSPSNKPFAWEPDHDAPECGEGT